MGKGLPSSGTISLSDLKAAFRAGSVIQTNTYSSVANGSITAPAAATWVKIECYGGGGGGRGYLGTEYGGGGGGYCKYEMPVTGSVTTFGYRVGSGGSGGVYNADGGNGNYSTANGIPTLGTIYAYGGQGGDSTGDSVAGGAGEYDFGAPGDNSPKKRGDQEQGDDGGTGVYYYGGDAAGPSGGSGGKSDGADGTAPGGGGAGKYIGAGTYAGGDGATGRVIFTWYNVGSTSSLRQFLSGGSYLTDQSTASISKNIPSSGTISLRDYFAADELGYNANTQPYGGGPYTRFDYDSVEKGDTAVASANLAISLSTGSMTHTSAVGKAFDKALDTTFNTSLLSRFQMQFTKTVGTVTGSATNTWITLSSGPKWYVNVSRSSLGSSSSTANGYLRFRRVDNSQEVVNVAVGLYAQADVSDDFDTK